MRIPANLRVKLLKRAIKNGLKVLTYDIETSHILARIWHIGSEVFVSHKNIKVPSKVITIQYKWAHEKNARYLEWDRVSDKYDDARNFDDSNMIEEFTTNILSKADIVIGQNNDKFDYQILNERAKAQHLSILDLKPSIDILKLSRKSVRSASHKLDYRSEQQGLGGKINMVDEDWVDVEERNVPAKRKMIPYGVKDTVDTEKLLWKELPYYKDLPVAVEREILKFLPKDMIPSKHKNLTPYCSKCYQRHRTSTKLKSVGKKYKCLNCKSSDHIQLKDFFRNVRTK